MATGEELAILRDPERDEQHASSIINSLTKLLVDRLVQGYQERQARAPPQLATGVVYVNTMVDNLRDSKVIVESSNFKQWRQQGGSASGGGESGKRPIAEASSSRSRPSPRLSDQPVRRYRAESDEDSRGEEDDSREEEGSSEEVGSSEEREGDSPNKQILLDSD